MRPMIVGGALTVALVIAGCSSGTPPAPTITDPGNGDQAVDVPLPDTIRCGTQYRPVAEGSEGWEEPTLTVARGDDLAGNSETVEFDTMTLTVTYIGEAPEGRVVTTTVETVDGEELVRSLYQLGDVPVQDVDYAGGHGFTGLQYVNHQGSQLQFWCQAQ